MEYKDNGKTYLMSSNLNRFQEKLRYIAKRLGGLEIVTTAK